MPAAVYVLAALVAVAVAVRLGLLSRLMGGADLSAREADSPELESLGLEYPPLAYNPVLTGAPRIDRCLIRLELPRSPQKVAREILDRRTRGRHELIERGWSGGSIVPARTAEARLVSGEMGVGLWHLNRAAINVYLLPTPDGCVMYVLASAREGLYRSRGAHEAARVVQDLVRPSR
ncbi:hypothetical protein ACIB24_08510 [Spongisporangium articulatum]|uniref:DUF1795 domain-containing protein n=1 Tax=Spongisporangium articulatum TaxID=3362603 RepID=A0ABW8AL67_9ACTN